MALPAYNKKYLDVAAQIELVKQRGLVVTDERAASDCLTRIGYYRLSGYWHVFRKLETYQKDDGKQGIRYKDEFIKGATFSSVADLYVFDKKLRMILLDAIERVEIAIRVNVALIIGARDPVAHRKPNQLHANFSKIDKKTGKTVYQNWIEKLEDNEKRSKEDFVTHFRANYSSPIPIWIAIELWDFGLMSKFVSGMRHTDQQVISQRYGSPRPDLFVSWIRSINFLRNTCAHHGRVWNMVPVDQAKVAHKGEIQLLDHLSNDQNAQQRLYGIVAPLQLLMRTINPSSEWCNRLKEHMAKLPAAQGINLSATGFPKEWEKLPLWN